MPKKGKKLDILNSVIKNAEESLKEKSTKNHLTKKISQIKEYFWLEKEIKKIEVYDNSHHQGKAPIGAMIAFNEDGFMKSLYRRYNITSKNNENFKINDNDFNLNNNDYLMMEEVLKRRFLGKILLISRFNYHRWWERPLNTALSVLNNLKLKM